MPSFDLKPVPTDLRATGVEPIPVDGLKSPAHPLRGRSFEFVVGLSPEKGGLFLRGKLDVPKERFIAFTEAPGHSGAETLYGWAGWTPLQRLKALLAIDENLVGPTGPSRELLDDWRRRFPPPKARAGRTPRSARTNAMEDDG